MEEVVIKLKEGRVSELTLQEKLWAIERIKRAELLEDEIYHLVFNTHSEDLKSRLAFLINESY